MPIDVILLHLFVQTTILHQWDASPIHLLLVVIVVVVLVHQILSLNIVLSVVCRLALLNARRGVAVDLYRQVVLVLTSSYHLRVQIDFVTIIWGRCWASLIFRILRETAGSIHDRLTIESILSIAIIDSVLGGFLAELCVGKLMWSNLICRELYQIFEKSLVILTFVTDSSILFSIAFCAIRLPIIWVVHVFQLDIGRQAIFLGCALVHWLLSGIQLLLVGLLGRLR